MRSVASSGKFRILAGNQNPFVSGGGGLAIVELLTEGMGGQVTVESETSLGAPFIVELPAVEPASFP